MNLLLFIRIVEVADIHVKKVSAKIAYEGQFSSLSLIKTDTYTGLKYDDVRKGMSLLDVNSSQPLACRSFQAEVWSLDGNSKTVKYKYEPVVNIKHIRQSCRVKKVTESIESSHIQSDDENDDNDSSHSHSTRRHQRKKISDKISSSDENYSISPDEKILLNFEFKNFPEFITIGSNLIINDSHLKAFGIITKINK